MIFEQILIILVSCLVLDIIIIIIMYQIYRRHKAQIEKIAVVLLLVLFLGSALYFINFLVQDELTYQITLLTIPFSFFFATYTFFSLLEGSGEIRPRREKIVILIYEAIILTILLGILLLNIRTVEIEGRFYFGVNEWALIIPIILLVLPLIHIITISLKYYVKLYEKEIRITYFIFFSLLFCYVLAHYLVIYSIEIRIFALSLDIVASIGGIIFLNKKHNFMALIHSTFAYKSLFVIRNNGQTLYSYEFERITDDTKDIKTIQYLIGGFIYAITHGIKEIIKEHYESQLRIMDFGNLKMLFYYGHHIFGVLFSREANNVIYNRLERFITQFEDEFKEFSEDKTSISLMEGKEITETIKGKIDDLLQVYFKF